MTVPEKVAWIFVQDGRVLVVRTKGLDVFYLPGGHRETGESDVETLVREIDEELQAVVLTESMEHFGTFETHNDGGVEFRMFCYLASHEGELKPSREIAEKAWFSYEQRGSTSPVDQMVFEALRDGGYL